MHRRFARVAALGLLLALAACGGGSGSDSTPEVPTTPPRPLAGDRIEPFDPAPLAKLAPVPAMQRTAPTRVRDASTVTLAPLAATPEKPSGSGAADAPLQIGVGRAIAETASAASTAALLQWQAGAQDTQVAALRFVVQGAQGLRLGLLVQALPAGTVLRVDGANDTSHAIDAAQLHAIAARNIAAGASERVARTWWSPEIAGEQVTLTLQIPAGATASAVRVAVPLLSQTISGDEQPVSFAKAGAGSCQIDVACSPESIEQGRSVARLRFVKPDGKGYQCTGTLMNDAASSGTPWLLTAHHCISDQATASTLVTDWLLRASSCGSPTPVAGHAQRTGGATLTYADERLDTSLLRLNEAAPPGVVYAGSYFGPGVVTGTTIAVVHHPEGDLQQINVGDVTGYSICSASLCPPSDREHATFFSVRWQQGVSQPGSSGSGAFVAIGARRYLVGQLFGGTSSCANPRGSDYFARFDVSYASALHRWLNP